MTSSWRPRAARPAGTLVVLAGSLLATLAFAASSADALSTLRQCDGLGKDTRCYTGSTYESYLNVRASLLQNNAGYKGTVYGICAKAVTSSNTVKDGSACTDNDFIRACLTNVSPQSRGYASHSGSIYWYRTINQYFADSASFEAAAATPADTVGVCGR